MSYFRPLATLFLCAAICVATSCKKERPSGVPLTPLDISINVNNPSYADIAVPGGWIYLSGGSMGLIVYRSSPNDFVAMDRHCPYRSAELCRVFVDDSEIIAKDTACCGSRFLVSDGSVVEGPAALGLQRYNTSFNGTTLRIYN
jgi:nitrite reductase/ring-hydroxylating ferredoxin subunit